MRGVVRGVVHHWDRARGFGKIGGEDRRTYFAHRTELLDVLDLTSGERVEFEPVENERGPRAANVRVLQAAGRNR